MEDLMNRDVTITTDFNKSTQEEENPAKDQGDNLNLSTQKEFEMSEKNSSQKKDEDNSTRAAVMHHVQHLMDNLEKKRDADKQMLEEFRLRMHTMVDQVCQAVEDNTLKQHEKTNKELKRKLQYLNDVLGEVCSLEKEFGQVKNVVGQIYKDITA